MISKLIANRVERIITGHITPEQIGFLPDRRIPDVVAIIQENIHSIKSRNLNACLMKTDLMKSYDHVE